MVPSRGVLLVQVSRLGWREVYSRSSSGDGLLFSAISWSRIGFEVADRCIIVFTTGGSSRIVSRNLSRLFLNVITEHAVRLRYGEYGEVSELISNCAFLNDVAAVIVQGSLNFIQICAIFRFGQKGDANLRMDQKALYALLDLVTS